LDGAQLIDIDVVVSAKDYNDETAFLDKIIVHNSKDILTGEQRGALPSSYFHFQQVGVLVLLTYAFVCANDIHVLI
jgi:hypothetical protein